jgi:hypothetical protein
MVKPSESPAGRGLVLSQRDKTHLSFNIINADPSNRIRREACAARIGKWRSHCGELLIVA